MSIVHILGGKSGSETLTVMLDGNTYVLNNTNAQFDIAVQAIKDDDEGALRKAVNMKQTIVDTSGGHLELKEGTVFYKGEVLNHSLVERILKMFSEGHDINPLLRFLENLLENPSFRAKNETYGFLSACSLPLTDDGYFMAYKKVGSNYFDLYTGTMDNSVGNTVSMPRNEVNEDSEQTCSAGLHVCSQSYLSHYGAGTYGSSGDTDRVLIVKVNPRDVVAVPNDYDNAKMRVCEYIVVGELKDNKDTLEDDFTTEYGGDEVDEVEEEEVAVEEVEETVSQVDAFADALGEIDVTGFVDFFDELFDVTAGEEPDVEDEVDVTFPDEVEEDAEPVKRARLSTQDVLDILSELDDDWTLVSIANAHDISPRQVGRIRDGKAWSDIKEEYERNKV